MLRGGWTAPPLSFHRLQRQRRRRMLLSDHHSFSRHVEETLWNHRASTEMKQEEVLPKQTCEQLVQNRSVKMRRAARASEPLKRTDSKKNWGSQGEEIHRLLVIHDQFWTKTESKSCLSPEKTCRTFIVWFRVRTVRRCAADKTQTLHNEDDALRSWNNLSETIKTEEMSFCQEKQLMQSPDTNQNKCSDVRRTRTRLKRLQLSRNWNLSESDRNLWMWGLYVPADRF